MGEEHNTDIVDMSTNDGICLLANKWTNSNYKEYCKVWEYIKCIRKKILKNILTNKL